MDKPIKEGIMVKDLLKMTHIERTKKGTFAANMALAKLRRDPIISDWLAGYPPTTARNYLANMNILLQRVHKNPKDLMTMDAAELKKIAKQGASVSVAEGKLGTAKNIINSATSFSIHYERRITFSYSEKIRGAGMKIELVPKPDQVYAIASAARSIGKPVTPRDKALIMTAWVTSLRRNAICDLRCGAVMGYTEGDCPIPVHVGNEKAAIGVDNIYCRDDKIMGYGLRHFYTFIAKEAFVELQEWLRWRTKNKGTFEKKDFLFTLIKKLVNPRQYVNKPEYGYVAVGTNLMGQSVWKKYKQSVAAAGIDAQTTSFHQLRDSFKSVMIRAEVDEEVRQAIMGHAGQRSEGNYFDYNDMEMARQQYIKADWSIAGNHRLQSIEKENTELKASIKDLQGQIKDQQAQIKDHEVKIGHKSDITERLAYLEGMMYERQRYSTKSNAANKEESNSNGSSDQ